MVFGSNHCKQRESLAFPFKGTLADRLIHRPEAAGLLDCAGEGAAHVARRNFLKVETKGFV